MPAKYSSAALVQDMIENIPPRPRTGNAASPESTLDKRRHRRSYTISAPFDFRTVHQAIPTSTSFSPLRLSSSQQSGGKALVPPLPSPSTTRSLPPTTVSSRSMVRAAPRVFHTTSIINDRFLDIPRLPDNWSRQHDRAICVLDSRNYSHPAIVAKLRRVFPDLRGTLNPLMIDKRLRILDQRLDIDYWSVGIGLAGEAKGPPDPEKGKSPHIGDREDSAVVLREPAPKAFKPSSPFKLAAKSIRSPTAKPKPTTSRFGTGF